MLHSSQARRLFDPERTLYVQRSLQIGDYIYALGEEMPWKSLGIDITTVRMWFRLRMVSHFKGGEQSAEAKATYRNEEVIEVSAEVVAESEEVVTDSTTEVTESDPEPVVVPTETKKSKKR